MPCPPAAAVPLQQAGMPFSGEDCMLSYLPLAHSFGRLLEEFALCVGGHIGYWQVRCVRWGRWAPACCAQHACWACRACCVHARANPSTRNSCILCWTVHTNIF